MKRQAFQNKTWQVFEPAEEEIDDEVAVFGPTLKKVSIGDMVKVLLKLRSSGSDPTLQEVVVRVREIDGDWLIGDLETGRLTADSLKEYNEDELLKEIPRAGLTFCTRHARAPEHGP